MSMMNYVHANLMYSASVPSMPGKHELLIQ